ncbi:MAG: hypothetical protein ABUL71_05105 [Gemmatimonadota bacterium]
MNHTIPWLGVVVVAASAAHALPDHHDDAQPRLAAASPCAADSNYQRLSFWVGDWDVVDSSGAHYAVQRVHSVIDGCALTVEWTGRVGDKGLGMTAFDGRKGEWRQVYVSNQVPSPSGVNIRKSDPSYHGPGVRFVSLVDPPATDLARSRVTIMPMTGHRAMQLFEDSSDGGKTWHVLFKAEHRLLAGTGQ